MFEDSIIEIDTVAKNNQRYMKRRSTSAEKLLLVSNNELLHSTP